VVEPLGHALDIGVDADEGGVGGLGEVGDGGLGGLEGFGGLDSDLAGAHACLSTGLALLEVFLDLFGFADEEGNVLVGGVGESVRGRGRSGRILR